jgi:hypothetical protein
MGAGLMVARVRAAPPLPGLRPGPASPRSRHFDRTDGPGALRFDRHIRDPSTRRATGCALADRLRRDHGQPADSRRPRYESQFATNHLGHFQLAIRLWPALARADGARVVSPRWGTSSRHSAWTIPTSNPLCTIRGSLMAAPRPQTSCSASKLTGEESAKVFAPSPSTQAGFSPTSCAS